MNRFERRISGSGGPRPGVAVCDPGNANVAQRGMLGGSSFLYNKRQSQRVNNNRNNSVISKLSKLKKEDGKIERLEKKLEDLENSYVMHVSSLEQKISDQEYQINLLTNSYDSTVSQLKKYIIELREKLDNITNDKTTVKEVSTINIKTINKEIKSENDNNNILLKVAEKS